MGMDYYIVPDGQTECSNDFPEELSYFFEQVGGYGEYAQVEQVSKILQIDLSLFQQMSYEELDEEDEEAEPIWHDVQQIIELIDNLLQKIDGHPAYYNEVIYNSDQINQRQMSSQLIKRFVDGQMTEEQAVQYLEKLQAAPNYRYPADNGYLTEGRIIEDLRALQNNLQCYQQDGIHRVKLVYM